MSTDVASIKPPTSVQVRVYRFPSLAATMAPMQRFLAGPGWTSLTDPSIPATGLPRVMTFDAGLRPLAGNADHIITFPARPISAASTRPGSTSPAGGRPLRHTPTSAGHAGRSSGSIM